MKKYLRFAFITVWIVFSRFYDVYATYQHTPDLKKEANPLASVLHLGWAPIILVVSALTFYVIYSYYVSTFKKYNLMPKEKGYSYLPFSTYLYFGEKAHWTAIFYKLPKDIKRLNHYLGSILAPALAYAGVVSTVMWLLINYTGFYLKYHSAPLVYAILAVGCIIIGLQWHRKMYRQYRAATSCVEE